MDTISHDSPTRLLALSPFDVYGQYVNGRLYNWVRRAPAVAIIAFEGEMLYLVNQDRPTVNARIWELPAGVVEEGEEPIVAAARECAEELQLIPEELKLLGSAYPTPGYSTELIYFYAAIRLRPLTWPAKRDIGEENMKIGQFTALDINRMVSCGDVRDMKTIAGLHMWRNR